MMNLTNIINNIVTLALTVLVSGGVGGASIEFAWANNTPGIKVIVVQPGAAGEDTISDAINKTGSREWLYVIDGAKEEIVFESKWDNDSSTYKWIGGKYTSVNEAARELSHPPRSSHRNFIELDQFSRISRQIFEEYRRYHTIKRRLRQTYDERYREIEISLFLNGPPVDRNGQTIQRASCKTKQHRRMNKFLEALPRDKWPIISNLIVAVKSENQQQVSRDAIHVLATVSGWLRHNSPGLNIKLFDPTCPNSAVTENLSPPTDVKNCKMEYSSKEPIRGWIPSFACDAAKVVAPNKQTKLGANPNSIIRPVAPPKISLRKVTPPTKPKKIVAAPSVKPKYPPSVSTKKIAGLQLKISRFGPSDNAGSPAGLHINGIGKGRRIFIVHLPPNRSGQPTSQEIQEAKQDWSLEALPANSQNGKHRIFAVVKLDPIDCKVDTRIRFDVNFSGKNLEPNHARTINYEMRPTSCKRPLAVEVYSFGQN